MNLLPRSFPIILTTREILRAHPTHKSGKSALAQHENSLSMGLETLAMSDESSSSIPQELSLKRGPRKQALLHKRERVA